MADITMSTTVSRDLLGLAPLEIAASDRYYLAAAQFLGGAVQWTRQQVSSPFVDGQVTTQRMRQNVSEQIGVEVRAGTHADLQAYTAELIQAFLQDSYTLTVIVAGTTYAWRCEAADYQVASWTTPRMFGLAGQVLFTVQRQPVALVGGVLTSGVSDFGASSWLSTLFGVEPDITGYYIALASNDPGPAADGSTLADLEPAPGSGYARQAYPTGVSYWAAETNYLTNLAEVVFPLPLADWGRLTHYVLCDSASAGEIYAWGAFTNPQTVTAGYLISIPVGALVLALTSLENSIAL